MIMTMFQLITFALIVPGTVDPDTSPSDNSNVTPVTCSELCVRLLCDTWQVEFDRAQAIGLLSQRSDGSVSLDRLVECLNAFGLECSVRRGTPELLNQARAPVILHLQPPDAPDTVGHYVVVANTETGLVAYDPTASAAPGPIDPERLKLMWTGVAIFVHPVQPEEQILFWSNLSAGFLGLTLLMLQLRRRPLRKWFRSGQTPNPPSNTRTTASTSQSIIQERVPETR